ncbi:phage portal protein [Micromonospora sp. NPDC000207]|uniref:phage portal protein n=1 Tax=Micromonospora sp. NPDC000207 TaxID=3154246 RepID=UPI00333244EF
MPIDVAEVRSPGWWMARLFKKLNERQRVARLELLHDYLHGRPRLPQGAENVRDMFAAFQRKACVNFPALVVGAVSDRLTPVGFQTAADDDASGDQAAADLWKRARLKTTAADVHEMMLNLGEAFVIVGPVDEDTGAPVVTAEDPRWMVAESDPARPHKLLAALKVLWDDIEGVSRAYLYLPGRVFVAVKPSKTPVARPVFTPQSWSWDAGKGGGGGQQINHARIPVVRFVNKDGAGEYEYHLDLIDRINHNILQRLVIASGQAFRQMAVSGLPDEDENGNEIDWSDAFVMMPGAMWQLPSEAKMWESQVTDLRPIIEATRDDITQLSAVTQTPMYMMAPAGQNQSAEGAGLSREGLVFRAGDRKDRADQPWSEVMSLGFLELGDTRRADVAKLTTIWAPVARLSLSEKADAASKAQNDMPRRSRLIHIWGCTPDEADRMMSEWVDEQMFAAQLAQMFAAQNPLPVNEPQLPSAAVPAQVPPAEDPLAGLSLEEISRSEPVSTAVN